MTRQPRPTFGIMTADHLPDPLPSAITRPAHHVQAVRAQSILETGGNGRAALAWTWALTGICPSPITLAIAPGRPPARTEILAEADADPEGSTAPPGVPTDYSDQIGEARRILTWLTGASDDIPLDDDHRGRFIGARDDYARTDAEIRQLRDDAIRNLAVVDDPGVIDPDNAARRHQHLPVRQDALWQRGVRDLTDWVLGDRPTSPLCHRTTAGLPLMADLSYEDLAAIDILAQAQTSRRPTELATTPPPQYGEAIQATIYWLRGESPSAHRQPPPHATTNQPGT